MIMEQKNIEERPWGQFEILKESTHFKSKIVQVKALQQLSYQSHAKREEHWVIIRGAGVVILDEKAMAVSKGSYVHIPLGTKHRIRNTGSEILEFVEVQLGSYFGEDDITRYRDDYNRT